MTTASRRARGRATQKIAAEYCAANGFPHAESSPASIPGSDILGMPGVDCEVKAARDMDRLAALRQSHRRAADFHLVIERPDGYGPERVSDWPCALTFGEALRLLRMAGYGEPLIPVQRDPSNGCS